MKSPLHAVCLSCIPLALVGCDNPTSRPSASVTQTTSNREAVAQQANERGAALKFEEDRAAKQRATVESARKAKEAAEAAEAAAKAAEKAKLLEPKKPVDARPEATLTAGTLWEEFGASEIAADKKYANKYVLISGEVRSIEKGKNGKYQIGFSYFALGFAPSRSDLSRMTPQQRKWHQEGGAPANIVCNISDEHKDAFEGVKYRDEVKVIARVVGKKKADVWNNYIVELDDARISKTAPAANQRADANKPEQPPARPNPPVVKDEPPKPPAEKPAMPPKKVDPPKKVEPQKPVETVTVKPLRDGVVLMATSKLLLTQAQQSTELRNKWVKDGTVIVLTEATDVELVSKENKYAEVRHLDKTWVVESDYIRVKR